MRVKCERLRSPKRRRRSAPASTGRWPIASLQNLESRAVDAIGVPAHRPPHTDRARARRMAGRRRVDPGFQDREPTPVHLGKGARETAARRRAPGRAPRARPAASRCGRPRAGAGRSRSPARDPAARAARGARDQSRQAAPQHLLRRLRDLASTPRARCRSPESARAADRRARRHRASPSM